MLAVVVVVVSKVAGVQCESDREKERILRYVPTFEFQPVYPNDAYDRCYITRTMVHMT